MPKYLLGNEKGVFIRRDKLSGKYVTVKNRNLADVWEERMKAQNVLKNGLSKKDRNGFHIIEIADSITEKHNDLTVSEINKINPNTNIEAVKKICDQDVAYSEINKWQNGLEKFTNFIQETEVRKDELNKSLSVIDKEIVDIEHYIELNNLNACQGFLAYKMLHNRLTKRRKIKNELQILSQLGDCKIDSEMMKEVQKAIHLLDNKKYTPRVLIELFN